MEGPCIFLLTKKWNTQFPSFFGGNKWRAHVTPCIFSQQKSGMLISKLFFSWETNGTHVFLSLTFESLLCPSPSLKKGFKRQMPIFKFFCCRTKMEGAYFLFSQKGGNLFLSSFFLVFSEKGNATHRLFPEPSELNAHTHTNVFFHVLPPNIEHNKKGGAPLLLAKRECALLSCVSCLLTKNLRTSTWKHKIRARKRNKINEKAREARTKTTKNDKHELYATKNEKRDQKTQKTCKTTKTRKHEKSKSSKKVSAQKGPVGTFSPHGTFGASVGTKSPHFGPPWGLSPHIPPSEEGPVGT